MRGWSLSGFSPVSDPMFQLPFSTFKGENFHEFHGFVAIHKSFSAKFGGVAPLAWQNQTIRKHFLHENHIFSNL